MKTVKTANGIKKIEDWNLDLVPLQLRSVLQDHRATLIDKLLHGGLATYIDYKFATKTTIKAQEVIKQKLTDLKQSGVDVLFYHSIFEMVLNNEYTALHNTLFYDEIDLVIKSNLFQNQLVKERSQLYFQ